MSYFVVVLFFLFGFGFGFVSFSAPRRSSVFSSVFTSSPPPLLFFFPSLLVSSSFGWMVRNDFYLEITRVPEDTYWAEARVLVT